MTDSPPKVALTAPVTILGRTMTVKRPTDAQVALMHRHGLITNQTLSKADGLQDAALEATDPAERERLEAQAAKPFSQGLTALAEIMDIIGFLFVEEEDQEFLVDQMKRGNLSATAMLAAFDPFTKKRGGKSGPAQRIRG